uniref:NHL repeat containing 4 n=1 Tax=Poecilia reticulata TaxID=8081 RepID=A0A3P9N7R4_POERE
MFVGTPLDSSSTSSVQADGPDPNSPDSESDGPSSSSPHHSLPCWAAQAQSDLAQPSWNTVRVLGVCTGMGPVLTCPWGICIDKDGNILVADWGEQHRIVLYPAQGVGWPIVRQGLSSPRGLTLLPDGQLAVSDSMHHCIKIYIGLKHIATLHI